MILRRTLRIILSLWFWIQIGGCSSLQADVRIVDDQGLPIQGAKVTINQFPYFMAFEGGYFDSGTTDDSGHVQLRIREYETPGSVDIRILLNRNEEWHTNIEFEQLPIEVECMTFSGHTVKDPDFGGWSVGPIGPAGTITADVRLLVQE